MSPFNLYTFRITEKPMKFIKIVIPTIVLSIVLVVAAFGSNGLKNLFNTRVNPPKPPD